MNNLDTNAEFIKQMKSLMSEFETLIINYTSNDKLDNILLNLTLNNIENFINNLNNIKYKILSNNNEYRKLLMNESNQYLTICDKNNTYITININNIKQITSKFIELKDKDHIYGKKKIYYDCDEETINYYIDSELLNIPYMNQYDW